MMHQRSRNSSSFGGTTHPDAKAVEQRDGGRVDAGIEHRLGAARMATRLVFCAPALDARPGGMRKKLPERLPVPVSASPTSGFNTA